MPCVHEHDMKAHIKCGEMNSHKGRRYCSRPVTFGDH